MPFGFLMDGNAELNSRNNHTTGVHINLIESYFPYSENTLSDPKSTASGETKKLRVQHEYMC